MANYKGTGITSLHKLFKERDPKFLTLFRQQLNPEETTCFERTMPITWVPIPLAIAVSKKAATVLFPNDPQCLFKLGKARAQETITGVYRFLFHLVSVETVMRNCARLWTQFFDEGKAWLDKTEGKNEGYYCVAGFPGLPEDFRKSTQGFIVGIMELAGAKNVKVIKFDDDPETWKWLIRWD